MFNSSCVFVCIVCDPLTIHIYTSIIIIALVLVVDANTSSAVVVVSRTRTSATARTTRGRRRRVWAMAWGGDGTFDTITTARWCR
jgi:hypothetical protein